MIINESTLSEALHSIEVAPPADLVERARRGGRRRRTRAVAVGAPLGVGVLTAGAVFGVQATGSSPSPASRVTVAADATPTSTPTPTTTPISPAKPPVSIKLYDHTFTFPTGWSAGQKSGHRHVNSGSSFPQGSDQEFYATGPQGAWFNVGEYRGALAATEYGVSSAVPDETHKTTVGNATAATIDIFGTSPRCTWTVSPNPDGTIPNVADKGTCPGGETTSTGGNTKLNVMVNADDSVLVEAGGIPVSEMKAILAAAIS